MIILSYNDASIYYIQSAIILLYLLRHSTNAYSISIPHWILLDTIYILVSIHTLRSSARINDCYCICWAFAQNVNIHMYICIDIDHVQHENGSTAWWWWLDSYTSMHGLSTSNRNIYTQYTYTQIRDREREEERNNRMKFIFKISIEWSTS